MSSQGAALNKYIISCPKIIVFKNPAHGDGVGDVFRVWFSYTQSTEACILRFKGSLYILFSLHVTSSSNITSVYSMEHIPGVNQQSQHVF